MAYDAVACPMGGGYGGYMGYGGIGWMSIWLISLIIVGCAAVLITYMVLNNINGLLSILRHYKDVCSEERQPILFGREQTH